MEGAASMSRRVLADPRAFLAAIVLASLLLPGSSHAGKWNDEDDEENDGDSKPKRKDKHKPTAVQVELAPGFTRMPYLQALARDSVLIVWDSPETGPPAVDFDRGDVNLRSVEATSDGSRRVAKLTGLEPGTAYQYRVRAGERVLAEGPSYRFSTDVGPTDRQFSFFVTGDVGDSDGDQATTAEAILRAAPRPEFGLITGDVVYSKGRSEDYDANLMSRWKDMLCSVNVWPALGNHDWKSDPETNWRREWFLPNNEHWYSFDWGSAHFIALDSRDADIYDPPAQVAWLRGDLQAHRDAEWTIVYYHHPGLTCTYKKNCEAVIQHLLPVFDEFDVDVVFNGHAHTYERLYPIDAGKPVNVEDDPNYVDPQGTIYVVSGAGAKFKTGKPTTRCGPTAFFLDRTVLWTHVMVDGPKMTIRSTKSADDALVDQITITKTGLAPSALESPRP
jgi:hypothetical protein